MPAPFVDELLAAMGTPQARLSCLTVLARWAGCTVYVPSESKARRRERAAAHMLANGMTQADVVQAVRERFNVAGRTAWRDVKAARKMSLLAGVDGK